MKFRGVILASWQVQIGQFNCIVAVDSGASWRAFELRSSPNLPLRFEDFHINYQQWAMRWRPGRIIRFETAGPIPSQLRHPTHPHQVLVDLSSFELEQESLRPDVMKQLIELFHKEAPGVQKLFPTLQIVGRRAFASVRPDQPLRYSGGFLRGTIEIENSAVESIVFEEPRTLIKARFLARDPSVVLRIRSGELPTLTKHEKLWIRVDAEHPRDVSAEPLRSLPTEIPLVVTHVLHRDATYDDQTANLIATLDETL